MSITVNGRIYQLILKQNTGNANTLSGTTLDGAELDISSYILTLGDLSWSVDENLTKLSLGNLSITVTDDSNNTVWNFIESNLTSANGLLPPWLVLNVDGNLAFIGLIRESPVKTQNNSTFELSINAVDWSSMLENRRIEPNDPFFSRANEFNKNIAWATGATIACNSVYNKELRRGHDRNLVAIDPLQAPNFVTGCSVYFANYDGWTSYNKVFTVIGMQTINVGGLGVRTCLYLGDGFKWQERPQNNANYGQSSTLNRVYSTTSNATVISETNLPVFLCQENYTYATAGTVAKTTIRMSDVRGLQPGDVLNKVTTPANPNDTAFSITVIDVDTISNILYLDKPLTNDLVSGLTSFRLDLASYQEAVLLPMPRLIDKALGGLAYADYTNYFPYVLPTPALSFVAPPSPPNQNVTTESLVSVSDIQPSLTGFECLGIGGLAWTGDTVNGWTSTTWTKKVSWTDKVNSIPPYLMPYKTLPSDANPDINTRGFTHISGLSGLKYDLQYDPVRSNPNTPVYQFVYDYSNLRCYTFKYNPGLTLTVETWNGTSWVSVPGFTSTGIGTPIQIVPFKDATSSVGSGYGLLALYSDGTVKTILSTVSLSATLSGDIIDPKTKRLQVTLIQTQNGVYYTTPTGYGKVSISGGVLTTPFSKINNSSQSNAFIPGISPTITPITNCFVYANNQIQVLCNVSYKKTITDSQFINETYLFQLNPIPQATPTLSTYNMSYICTNISRTTMMVKSPVNEDILGFMGSRLFTISTSLSNTVERFTVINQTASSIIEFITTMTNTVASPTPNGILKLISRGYNGTPTNINLDMVSIKTNRWNQHLTDCVVIKGSNASVKGVAVSSTQQSGMTISYQNDMWIKNGSQAQGIANAYLSFFQVPRHEVEQVWFSNTYPAIWESLQPLQILTINGGTTQYYLTGLSINYQTQTATAQLLEKI